IKGVVPGLKYNVSVQTPMKIDNTSFPGSPSTLLDDVVCEPGETKQLGDLKFEPKPETPAAIPTGPAPDKPDATPKPAEKTPATPPLDPHANGGRAESPSPATRQAEAARSQTEIQNPKS